MQKTVLSFLLPLLLCACASPASLTPETAAIGFLSAEYRPFGLKQIDLLSFKFLHKQPFKEHVVLLVTFRGEDSAANGVECIALMDSYQDPNQTWSATGDGNCRLMEAALIPHFKSAGIASLAGSEDPLFYSYAFEELWGDDLRTATITWEDGLTQDVPLNHNIYLAVREGQFVHTLVEGKDETGRVVYSRTHSPPQ